MHVLDFIKSRVEGRLEQLRTAGRPSLRSFRSRTKAIAAPSAQAGGASLRSSASRRKRLPATQVGRGDGSRGTHSALYGLVGWRHGCTRVVAQTIIAPAIAARSLAKWTPPRARCSTRCTPLSRPSEPPRRSTQRAKGADWRACTEAPASRRRAKVALAPQVHLGYKLLLLAAVTYWGSGITRSLVDESLDNHWAARAAFSDLSEAISARAPICSQGTLGTRLAQSHVEPSVALSWDKLALRQLLVLREERGRFDYSAVGSLEAMLAPEPPCTGILIDESMLYSAAALSGNLDYCDSQIAGPEIAEPTLLALPVRMEKEGLVSYLISKYVEQERYNRGMQEHKTQTWHVDCPWAVTIGATRPITSTSSKLQVGAHPCPRLRPRSYTHTHAHTCTCRSISRSLPSSSSFCSSCPCSD